MFLKVQHNNGINAFFMDKNIDINRINTDNFADFYSDGSLMSKLKKSVLKVGRKAIKKILTLYYVLLDHDTPKKAKMTIIGTLGYYIFPLDAVPDFIPLAGYTDDMAVLTLAFITVFFHIKQVHRDQAEQMMQKISLRK